MRLFDEELREVFLYEYGEGSEECSWTIILAGLRNIPDEEFEATFAEHKQMERDRQSAINALRISTGVDSSTRLAPQLIEERRRAMDAFGSAIANLTVIPRYLDFLMSKFDLQILEGKSI